MKNYPACKELIYGLEHGVMVLSYRPIVTASANSISSDLECTSRVYFDDVMLMSLNVTLTSQKPCQYNNKFDCSKTNSYNLQQDALNEV